MTHRIARLAVAAGIAVTIAAPAAQHAYAWSCTDEVGQAACFVVGTTCSLVPDRDGGKLPNPRELCTFG
jgi:hypothetical protein